MFSSSTYARSGSMYHGPTAESDITLVFSILIMLGRACLEARWSWDQPRSTSRGLNRSYFLGTYLGTNCWPCSPASLTASKPTRVEIETRVCRPTANPCPSCRPCPKPPEPISPSYRIKQSKEATNQPKFNANNAPPHLPYRLKRTLPIKINTHTMPLIK